MSIYPTNLQSGDEIRVIAPARSLSLVSPLCQEIANTRFANLGVKLSFSEFANERDQFDSSEIAHRVHDLQAAFIDPKVKGIITVIGGYNSNQLLPFIDWEVIKENPKILCGFSDITVLNNAIFAKTGMVTYSGPHYSTFGQKYHFGYTLEYFYKCLFSKEPYRISSSEFWTDDPWYIDQEGRHQIANDGAWVLQEGAAEGIILGGNLCSFNLLQGTIFFPQVNYSTLLFVEDTSLSTGVLFDRDLQSLLQAIDSKYISGLVIGRFQAGSNISFAELKTIIDSKVELKDKPVIGNVDFGHTDPRITFPIGGKASLNAGTSNVQLLILEH